MLRAGRGTTCDLPFDAETTSAREWLEGLASGRTSVPSPSSRVSTLEGEAAESVAQRRGVTLKVLSRQMRGDLDWIVLKAIDPDRNRRYPSPFELAADLERHLRSEAVLAGPPSWSYQAGRFVRRHRLAVAAAGSLFLAAILFGSGMAWLARETARERDRANDEAEIATRVTGFTRDCSRWRTRRAAAAATSRPARCSTPACSAWSWNWRRKSPRSAPSSCRRRATPTAGSASTRRPRGWSARR